MFQAYLQLLDTEKEKQDFELLYEKYRKLMHWVANSILHDYSLAEDAVHEAFLRIIKNFHKIHDISCPETKNFVVIIVRNISINMLDKKSMHEMESSTIQEINGYDDTVDKLMEKELIRSILSLPSTDKEILFLYGYLGYNIPEIAAFLDITDAAAYKRLQRARNVLHDKLKRGNEK